VTFIYKYVQYVSFFELRSFTTLWILEPTTIICFIFLTSHCLCPITGQSQRSLDKSIHSVVRERRTKMGHPVCIIFHTAKNSFNNCNLTQKNGRVVSKKVNANSVDTISITVYRTAVLAGLLCHFSAIKFGPSESDHF
jgi:hypothetical protein